jgi:hypothetical protein
VTICSVCTSRGSTCVSLDLSRPDQVRQDSLHRESDRFGGNTEPGDPLGSADPLKSRCRATRLQRHRQTHDRGVDQAILPSERNDRVMLRTDKPVTLGQLRRQLADKPTFWWLVEALRQGSGKLLLLLRKGDPAEHDQRRHTARPAVEQRDEAGWHIAERARPPRIGSMFPAAWRTNQTRASDLKGEP